MMYYQLGLRSMIRTEPAKVLDDRRLHEARVQVNTEVERCTHTAPEFSPDGKVAVFRVCSEAQVHQIIATRWAGHLNSKALEIVLVANEGYLPGKVNFSCRITRCARSRDPSISVIERLQYYASLDEPDCKTDDEVNQGTSERQSLLSRLGNDLARGHTQASGGIVGVNEFEDLMRVMRIGEKTAKKQEEGKGLAERR